ncbi:translation initiation factor IF-2 [Christensenella sp. MSJ-20]|uniref:translation initiation factor IF-2 n=1 Tax=Christensenella sp. MSJ-20 TaxID=2841518 RepID=UPI001C75E7AF|nr:translation initiation factor IF-2 [Christensenella sp. MSJ-20]
MTEKTGRAKINEMAKQLAGSTKEGMEAIRQAQSSIAARMETARKLESELVRKAREREELAQSQAAEAQTAAVQSENTPQVEKEAPPKVSQAEAKPAPVEVAAEAAPVPKQIEVQEKAPEVKAPQTEQKQEVPKAEKPKVEAPRPQQPQQAAVQTPKAAGGDAAQVPKAEGPKPAAQVPPRRAPRTDLLNKPIRDDAAARNGTRIGVPSQQQRSSFGGRPQGQGGPRQAGGYNRDQRPGGYNREGGRPQSGNRPGGFNREGGRPQGGNRPGGFGGQQRSGGFGGGRAPMPAAPEKGRVSNYDPNRSNYIRVFDNDKRGKNKKALDKERRAQMMITDDDVVRTRKNRRKQNVEQKRPEAIVIDHAVITTEMVMVKTLAEKIGKPAAEIIKKLLNMGVLATINNEIDFDTAALIAADYDIELEQKLDQTAEDVLIAEDREDDESELTKRPPVVTIMGHVDHGKTSLLDAIRSTRVTEGEAGGITQHIGAYQVEVNGELITFLDTPGHEAFTAMRARGAQVTDVVILVVAADDGIMPQTIEAINHSKAAGVPIIVAINKIDRPNANPDRVMQELTEHGLVWEEWGGDTVIVPVSAVTHQGLDTLLEMVILVSDVLELKANPNRLAKGTIVEARLDKGRGPVATVLVQNGTLKVGQTIVAGTCFGRVRAMINDKGEKVEEALPSQPVEVLGFGDVPDAGDTMYAVEADKLSRQVVEERKNRIKNEQLKNMSKVSLDDLFSQISQGQIKDLNIIVKADVQGSVEAVKASLEKLSNDEVRVRCIHGGVGGITQADVMLATASSAIIIGFNVRPDATARSMADQEKVDIRLYRVIYNAIEDVEKAMKGMLEPIYEEVVLGHAQVRETFKVSAIGTIAGCYVQDGKLTRNCSVRLIRDSIVIYEGKLDSLKRFKDDVREVLSGFECGLSLNNFNDIKVDDVLEAYTVQEVER